VKSEKYVGQFEEEYYKASLYFSLFTFHFSLIVIYSLAWKW